MDAISSLNVWRCFVRVENDSLGRRQRDILGPMNKDICARGVMKFLA